MIGTLFAMVASVSYPQSVGADTEGDIIHDAEHYILAAQHGER